MGWIRPSLGRTLGMPIDMIEAGPAIGKNGTSANNATAISWTASQLCTSATAWRTFTPSNLKSVRRSFSPFWIHCQFSDGPIRSRGGIYECKFLPDFTVAVRDQNVGIGVYAYQAGDWNLKLGLFTHLTDSAIRQQFSESQ
jgi:hypothetical protein